MGDRLLRRRPHVGPLARWLALPAVLIAAGGCGLVPTGGPVLKGRSVQPADPVAAPYVRVIPTGPRAGWTPEQIVRGFLSDSASFRDDHGVAREYLAPAVRAQWEPSRGVRVYDDDSGLSLVVEQSSKNDAVVTMKADLLATIDARGQYTAASPGARFTTRFRLRSVGGEWRIVSFPQGLLLTERDVDRAYRTRNLYFFDSRFETLVPDPIYVRPEERDRLPTRLARALVRGATSWYEPAVRSAFPPGTRLTEDVTVTSGTATVRLDGAAALAGDRALGRMSAQLVWTLAQLPNIQQVRLRVAGEAVHVGDSGPSVSTEDWASLNPAAAAGTVHGYLVRDNKLLVTTQQGLEPAPGPAGSKQVSVRNPAVALDSKRAAWLSGSGDTVFVGELREGGGYHVALHGGRYRSPSWDRYGNLWIVEDTGGGSKVWMLADGAETVAVPAPGLGQRSVQALRVARDGTRMALVVREGNTSRVLLGRIERDGDEVRIDGLMRMPTDLVKVVDVAWRDQDRLAVLGKDAQGVFAPYLVDVDGTGVSPTGQVGKMVSIAAAPGAPMLVERNTGDVFQSPDDLGWEPLGRGRDPVYPG